MKTIVVLYLAWLVVALWVVTVTGGKCNPNCSSDKAGWCQSNGRCLCFWGWTGPNAEYILTGNLKNRIQADHCMVPCHYTHDYRNQSCATSPTQVTTALPGSTFPIKTQIPRTGNALTTATPCNPNCTIRGHGVCQSDGRCLCWWGWTGPHAVYIQSGSLRNRILADYCFTACHYTHDYRNPACAKIPVPAVCSVPPKPISPPVPCDPQCNAGVYHGQCLTNGRCLCWWGWTGPNSCYVTGNKTLTNRILANSCNVACHYTHDYRNDSCVTNKTRSQKPQKPNGPLASAVGAKSALNSEGKTSPEDSNKGASSRPTGSSAAVVVPVVAALILAAFAALILLGYKKKKRQNRVAPQTITYSDSGESEPLLRTFHYNSRT